VPFQSSQLSPKYYQRQLQAKLATGCTLRL
jgi:hypothetical protein